MTDPAPIFSEDLGRALAYTSHGGSCGARAGDEGKRQSHESRLPASHVSSSLR